MGTTAFAALGLAITGFVRSAEGSSAIVNAIYLPMTFISGAWFSTEAMPAFLQAIAEILPLTHLLRLLRTSIVSGETVIDHPTNLIALVAWGVIGLVFRAAGLPLGAARNMTWEPGRPLPDIELVDADGEHVRLTSLHGRPLVLEVTRHIH